ncbi:Gluconolactonase precursor [Planctomycetes bacterium Pan216]|uniref:Gluconolactonase n=1 Tax=Kolteria novifilia TaxID=2527975 RepID=A0A518AZR4_9BACT|nr:Gluconolactonase precursor [Planctomycetes bacterium Pan216]
MTRFLLLLTLGGVVLTSEAARSEEAMNTNYPTIGKVVRESGKLDNLVDPDAKIDVLASGFDWSEGPIWVADGGYLLFSDIPPNKIMKWKEGEGLSLFMHPSGYTGVADYGKEPGSNGLTLDPKGQLILCEHGDRRVSKLTKSGGKITLADHYNGKRLNSPNDVIVASNGDLIFTDPPYGLPNRWDDPLRELDFCGVYRLTPEGELTLLTKEMTRPNGLALSPDEKTLYVANSDPEKAIWMSFPVNDDGTLGKGEVFYDATESVGKLPGLPDGLKVDVDGNLFATGPGGVLVFTPDGELLGRIATGEKTANCAWGDDGSTLYLTSDMHLCRIKTKTKGAGWDKR